MGSRFSQMCAGCGLVGAGKEGWARGGLDLVKWCTQGLCNVDDEEWEMVFGNRLERACDLIWQGFTKAAIRRIGGWSR